MNFSGSCFSKKIFSAWTWSFPLPNIRTVAITNRDNLTFVCLIFIVLKKFYLGSEEFISEFRYYHQFVLKKVIHNLKQIEKFIHKRSFDVCFFPAFGSKKNGSRHTNTASKLVEIAQSGLKAKPGPMLRLLGRLSDPLVFQRVC